MAIRFYDSLKTFVPQPLRTRLSNMAWDALGLGWTLPSGSAISIRNLADWRTYNEIFVDQDYDAAIRLALDLNADKPCFNALDLGANVGFFSLRLVHLKRGRLESPKPLHIVAVEGSKHVATRLRATFANAQLSPECSVDVVQGLAGQRVGRANFDESPFHVMNRASDASGGQQVDYVDLDRATERYDAIHLLKCDIEGSEEAFITNYPQLLARTAVAVFEFHEALCDTRAAIARLQTLGFRQLGERRVGADCFLAWFQNDSFAAQATREDTEAALQ